MQIAVLGVVQCHLSLLFDHSGSTLPRVILSNKAKSSVDVYARQVTSPFETFDTGLVRGVELCGFRVGHSSDLPVVLVRSVRKLDLWPVSPPRWISGLPKFHSRPSV